MLEPCHRASDSTILGNNAKAYFEITRKYQHDAINIKIVKKSSRKYRPVLLSCEAQDKIDEQDSITFQSSHLYSATGRRAGI